MCSAFMKGLRFASTQESCFEAWKRSYNASSALQATKPSDVDYVEVLGVLFADLDFETVIYE